MKQHISVKQLNELSDKGRKAFYKYLKSKGIKVTEWKDSFGGDNYEVEEGMLLSIGQMIEFLAERKEDIHIGRTDILGIWTVGTHWNDGKQVWEQNDKELADALWEACKEVLN